MSDKTPINKWTDLQNEFGDLNRLHGETATDPTKCREFNRLSAAFLQKLEDTGCDKIADMFMDLLCGCSPKDFSHCDNHEQTKRTLERIKARMKESLAQSQDK